MLGGGGTDLNQLIEALMPAIEAKINELLPTANIDAHPDPGMVDQAAQMIDHDPGMVGAQPGLPGQQPPPESSAPPAIEHRQAPFQQASGSGADFQPGMPGLPPKPLGQYSMLKYSLSAYMKDNGEHDLEGAKSFLGGLDQAGQDKLCKYMKDEAGDDEKAFYEKASGKDISDPDVDGMKTGPERNQREGQAEQYARLQIENRGLKQRYQRAVQRIEQLESELGEVRKSEAQAIRYAKLEEMQSQGYAFDMESQKAFCDTLNDDQFEAHMGLLPSICPQVPQGDFTIPVDSPSFGQAQKNQRKLAGTDQPTQQKADRYSKQARELTLKLRNQPGKEDTKFGDVLQDIIENDGTPVKYALSS